MIHHPAAVAVWLRPLLFSLLFALRAVTVGNASAADSAAQPLFPLWPEQRISLNGQEVQRIYREVIAPLNKKMPPSQGNPARCETGSMDQSWLKEQERLLNSYRQLAGSTLTTFTDELNAQAAQAALITAAKGWPEHHPDPKAACYTPAGAKATAASNLSNGGNQTSMDDWIDDNGVYGAGHRLLSLHPGNTTLGLGLVGSGMALHRPVCKGTAAESHIAVWPPVGYVPMQFGFGYPSFTFTLTPHLGPNNTLSKLHLAQPRVRINGWPRPAVAYPKLVDGSYVFEVHYGDRKLLKQQLPEKGVVLDVTIGPVLVNGTKAEIRYRTIFFDPAQPQLPVHAMPAPGFYPVSE